MKVGVSVRFGPEVEESASCVRAPGVPPYELRSKTARAARRLRIIAYRAELLDALKSIGRDPTHRDRDRAPALREELDIVEELLDKFPDRTWYEPDNESDLDDDERAARDVAAEHAAANAAARGGGRPEGEDTPP